MAAEPICVHRTNTPEEADIVIAWLDDRGVQATAMDRGNPGVLAFGATDLEGIAICVADEETARRAKELLEEHARERTAATPGTATDPIEIKCEECGETVAFPPETQGTVQDCPQCGAHLDVDSDGD